MPEQPTEDEIREALEWLDAVEAGPWQVPERDLTLFRTLLYIARRGALLDGAAVLLREVEVSWRTERRLYPPTIDALRALLARIAPETETDDGD